ncbi:MAG TPA: choice-of-anchor tandem repeat GloVer-containing protein [Rhizomicrobium sp.]
MLAYPQISIRNAAMLVSFAAFPALAAPQTAAAAETVLHSFCGSGTTCTGATADAHGLIQDSSGNLYGVTGSGGANGKGSVYKLAKSGSSFTYTQLYSFCPSSGCSDGATPVGALVLDSSGNLYGVTASGGGGCSANPNGCGTIYKLTSSGTLTTLYSFCPSSGCADGRGPQAGLTYVGASGGSLYDGLSNLYGTTIAGGTNDRGTVYKLASPAPTPVESVLYNFCPSSGCSDGATPGELITDSSGDIFGVTLKGGVDGDGDGFADGVVFELAPSGGSFTYTRLYAFCPSSGCSDGSNPNAHLVQDGSGNLYGTTNRGGNSTDNGVIFKIVPNGTSSTESVLHSFCTSSGCPDGAVPQGGLSIDGSGNLFGTAQFDGGNSGGVLFEQSGSTYSVLYDFCAQSSCSDGKAPDSGAILDSAGKLYGTTAKGGTNDGGVVFKFKP